MVLLLLMVVFFKRKKAYLSLAMSVPLSTFNLLLLAPLCHLVSVDLEEEAFIMKTGESMNCIIDDVGPWLVSCQDYGSSKKWNKFETFAVKRRTPIKDVFFGPKSLMTASLTNFQIESLKLRL